MECGPRVLCDLRSDSLIYLDHCATTPLDPRVKAAMDDATAQSERGAAANPSSVHAPGRAAKGILSRARRDIADLIGATPEEIIFTASASEANNLLIKGLAFATRAKPFRIAVSNIEHDCVIEAARWLARKLDWVQLREIPCGNDGVVRVADIEKACSLGLDLICLMMVNHETGMRQPIEAAAEIAHRHGALLHTDAVQAPGRVEVNLKNLGCDSLSLSAHKLHGPQGIGLLLARRGLVIDSLIHGGHQERGVRAGTENWIGAVGLSVALSIAIENQSSEAKHLRDLEEAFLSRIRDSAIEFALNGESNRAPGILNISIKGGNSHDLVAGMDIEGIAISAGAACSSGVIEPSRILKAMCVEPWRIESGLRISFGRTNTLEDAATAADALVTLSRRLTAERGFRS